MFCLCVPFPFSIPIPVASLRREGPGSIRLVLSLLRGHITSQPRAKQTRGTDTLTLSHISHPSTHTPPPLILTLTPVTLTPVTLTSLISHSHPSHSYPSSHISPPLTLYHISPPLSHSHPSPSHFLHLYLHTPFHAFYSSHSLTSPPSHPHPSPPLSGSGVRLFAMCGPCQNRR